MGKASKKTEKVDANGLVKLVPGRTGGDPGFMKEPL
jgi:hypothetical protein